MKFGLNLPSKSSGKNSNCREFSQPEISSEKPHTPTTTVTESVTVPTPDPFSLWLSAPPSAMQFRTSNYHWPSEDELRKRPPSTTEQRRARNLLKPWAGWLLGEILGNNCVFTAWLPDLGRVSPCARLGGASHHSPSSCGTPETGLCLGMVTWPLTSCDVADNRVPKEVN